MKNKGQTVGVALAVLFAIGCLAPGAEPVTGDLRSAIEKGITGGTQRFDHGLWDQILQKHVKENGRQFDYVGLKKEEDKLSLYLLELAEAELSSLTKNELLALFANAYNAYTVKTIVEHVLVDGTYAIGSIRDISNVFDRERHIVGGFTLSLNNMEHNILRPLFKDPRLHFAVNCASASCPPIPHRAFEGDRVGEQLEEAARHVLSSPDYVRVEDDDLEVSKLMDWYGTDFVNEDFFGAEKDLTTYIRKYASPEVREWIDSQSSPNVRFMGYDWSLNRK